MCAALHAACCKCCMPAWWQGAWRLASGRRLGPGRGRQPGRRASRSWGGLVSGFAICYLFSLKPLFLAMLYLSTCRSSLERASSGVSRRRGSWRLFRRSGGPARGRGLVCACAHRPRGRPSTRTDEPEPQPLSPRLSLLTLTENNRDMAESQRGNFPQARLARVRSPPRMQRPARPSLSTRTMPRKVEVLKSKGHGHEVVPGVAESHTEGLCRRISRIPTCRCIGAQRCAELTRPTHRAAATPWPTLSLRRTSSAR
jgi:hypothetical protein